MNQRTLTMANRIKVDFPEFVEMLPPTERNDGLYRRIRHIQAKGDCCGVPMSKDELRAVIALAQSETIKDKNAYLCVCLSRFKIEKTLESIRAKREMRTSEVARAFAKYVAGITAWQLRTAFGLARGKYSMNDVVCMCELCAKKEKPASYLIGILRRGYKPNVN